MTQSTYNRAAAQTLSRWAHFAPTDEEHEAFKLVLAIVEQLELDRAFKNAGRRKAKPAFSYFRVSELPPNISEAKFQAYLVIKRSEPRANPFFDDEEVVRKWLADKGKVVCKPLV